MEIAKLTFKALGTEIDLQILAESKDKFSLAQRNISELREYYKRIEKIFSRFDEKSELSQLNSCLGEFKKVSSEMLVVARKALLHHESTEGYFDPRVIDKLENAGYDQNFKEIKAVEKFPDIPMEAIAEKLNEDLLVKDDQLCFKRRMDFAGVVKGFVTDEVSKILQKNGWQNFLVDSGGDMFFWGQGEDGKKWRIGVEGIPEKSLMLELSGQGIATSGISRRKWERAGKRFHHIVNPKNPNLFSFELQSVTVVAESTELADVWAKTLFVVGKDEAKRIAEKKEVACVILEYNGRAWISSALRRYLIT